MVEDPLRESAVLELLLTKHRRVGRTRVLEWECYQNDTAAVQLSSRARSDGRKVLF